MFEETIEYNGYRLNVFRDGLGWRVFIYAPGSDVPLCDVPVQPAEDGGGLVIRAAPDEVARIGPTRDTRQRKLRPPTQT